MNNISLIVRCSSVHMASFALLDSDEEPVIFEPVTFGIINKVDLSLTGVAIVGLTFSILSLLATIICLIIFK